jgi:hypothetical protein
LYNLIELTIENCIKVVRLVINAVIAEAILRIVICAYAL